jgi:hypothetical protein
VESAAVTSWESAKVDSGQFQLAGVGGRLAEIEV